MHARTQMEEGGSRALGFYYVAFVFAPVITIGWAIIIIVIIVVIVIVTARRVDGVGFSCIWRIIISIVGLVGIVFR